ncbi:hypothetical protein Sinac_1003 [Singulisphaera acidiphila DSM 18658]|uniref:Uncharacterized protein n=1 Tax=Singulisphaera acidiphila (strain ATCC BAA-1392 / DSM 18658 / VKM B-2454 / MOB10) TaxID=886293 RepID=L0D971_SINAD|nr:hypothetical protein Sinac_1003 [Singulisphaera acidiphila DSM 18658]
MAPKRKAPDFVVISTMEDRDPGPLAFVIRRIAMPREMGSY